MKSERLPEVSVIMTVYNGENYLEEAVASILGQTFRDFEFIIVNDGSTDNTLQLLHSYVDSRLQIISQRQNKGRVAALNKAFGIARGEFVAIMDADDVSTSVRLEKQVNYMRAHPEINILGTNISLIDQTGSPHEKDPWQNPTSPLEIRWGLFFRCPVNNPTIMMRRKVLVRVGGYREGFPLAQDYDLWLRCAPVYKIANLPEICLRYRIHPESATTVRRDTMIARAENAVMDALKRLLGQEITLEQVRNLRNRRSIMNSHQAINTVELLFHIYEKVMESESKTSRGFDAVQSDLVTKLLGLAWHALRFSPSTAAIILARSFRFDPKVSTLTLINKFPKLLDPSKWTSLLSDRVRSNQIVNK